MSVKYIILRNVCSILGKQQHKLCVHKTFSCIHVHLYNQNINKNAENLGHVTPGGELQTSTQIHNQKENTCIHKYF